MNPTETPFECGICGNTSAEVLFVAGDLNFRTTEEIFSIARCSACGTSQTVPPPPVESLGRYYPPVYYPIGGFNPSYDRRRIKPFQRDKVDIVRRFRTSGTLLDAGCGAGFFVREASESGFDAQGIEFSRDAVEFGRRYSGVRITEGEILRADFPDGSFDIVTFWQVMEHLPNPVETLARIRKLLRQGGILIVSVPNFNSVQARVFRSRWYHLEVPRHLFHFTPETLRNMLTAGGFKVLEEFQRSREHNWAGILGSLIPIVPADGSFVGRLARLAALRPLSRTAAALETGIRRGGTITLVCTTGTDAQRESSYPAQPSVLVK